MKPELRITIESAVEEFYRTVQPLAPLSAIGQLLMGMGVRCLKDAGVDREEYIKWLRAEWDKVQG